MLEKALHGANIATCCTALATAADVTLTGGAATTIAAALSGVALFKKADPYTSAVTTSMAEAFDAEVKQRNLTGDRRRIAVQMFALYPPNEEDNAKGSMIPKQIAELMRDKVKAAAIDPAHKTNTALVDYAALIEAAVTPLTKPNTQEAAMLAELLQRGEASGKSDLLRNEGITESAIIRLAQRITADTDTVGQAWLELQNAMDIAVRVQAEGQVKSNHGDFVDTVLARVAHLAKDGDYTAAGAEIDAALSQADAQMARLLTSGAEIALLDRDTAKAAALLVRKADMEAGGVAEFETLCALRNHYYETGRIKVRNLDCALAVDLAHLVVARAPTAEERVSSRINLGNALASLGRQERGTGSLEQAIAAHTLALKERTRDRDPQGWSLIQMNLGAALSSLGHRESGTARLDQAVTAFTEALKENTRRRVPMEWAKTQMNLGGSLSLIAERENGTDRLEQAVTAFCECLKERTRNRDPLGWALTQMNLGNTLANLGRRQDRTEPLEQAVTAYTEALEECTHDRNPMQWAMTQLNLGNTLRSLGKHRDRTDCLYQARAAFSEALKEYTRGRAPLDWAMTQGNLANLELAFFDKTSDPAHLDRAAGYVSAAREVFMEANASHYIEISNQQLAAIQSRRS